MRQLELIREITGGVLRDISPAELFLLPSYDPASRTAGKTSGGPQGFGGNEQLVLLLPFVYKFLETFIAKLASHSADFVWTRLAELVQKPPDPDENILSSISVELEKLGMPPGQIMSASKAILHSLREHRQLLLNVR